ncbi:uncharacterized protein OCT59_014714 [Rhizophagus irregularis]|uniref:uncharacterized protein n=1 Tax=Rhizophagus irregularis TaxID=588596 RepID=UPI0033288269|nr:hypothetical protein OCT59_014714 [Rhizophagus irregularis]
MEKLELAIANEQARQEARKAAGKAKPLPELDEETCLLIENGNDVTMTDLTINSTPYITNIHRTISGFYFYINQRSSSINTRDIINITQNNINTFHFNIIQ